MINNFISLGIIIDNFEDANLKRIINNFEDLEENDILEIIFLINNDENKYFIKLENLLKKSSLTNFLLLNTFQVLDKTNAEWVILSNSIGERVCLIEQSVENISEVYEQIMKVQFNDVLILSSKEKSKISVGNKIYLFFIKMFFKNGKKISNMQKINKEIKIFSRNIINQHSNSFNPSQSFQKEIYLNLESDQIKNLNIKNNKSFNTRTNYYFGNTSNILFNSFMPMRIISILSLSASFLSLAYSLWILYIYTKKDFIEGWVSTNLVLTIFFFLTSIILFFISEYLILQTKNNESNQNIKKEYTQRGSLENYDLNLKEYNDETNSDY